MQMCFIRMIAYLCLNMSIFDAVDFNEHRSEEVMFLLTLSVVRIPMHKTYHQW